MLTVQILGQRYRDPDDTIEKLSAFLEPEAAVRT